MQRLIDGAPCVGIAQDTDIHVALQCQHAELHSLASKPGTQGKVGPTNRRPIFAHTAVSVNAGVGTLKAENY